MYAHQQLTTEGDCEHNELISSVYSCVCSGVSLVIGTVVGSQIASNPHLTITSKIALLGAAFLITPAVADGASNSFIPEIETGLSGEGNDCFEH